MNNELPVTAVVTHAANGDQQAWDTAAGVAIPRRRLEIRSVAARASSEPARNHSGQWW
jgi:hypothetical protein